MTFKDHFSTQAGQYTQFRPRYPDDLFVWLGSLVPQAETAWDCGTGNGQAAEGLVKVFKTVVATDASRDQIEQAAAHSRIAYLVAPAEQPPISANSVDLVAVSQALHWFDFEAFYAEVRRVTRAGGVLAAWCYGLAKISPEVDAVIDRLYGPIAGSYWPPERRLVEEHYSTIPFPFERIAPPRLAMRAQWNLSEWTGYLGTWSAVVKYRKVHGADPLALIATDLAAAWGPADARREIAWPLDMLVGRVHD